MKRLFLNSSIVFLLCISTNVFSEVVITKKIPLEPPRVGEESMTMMSSTSTTLKRSSTLKTTSSIVYYPVSAYVDEVALTVTFTQPVGMANVMVYDANGQLVDMITVDTNSSYEAVLSTEAWASGNYTLVVSYGTTTLTGAFTF